MKKLNQIMAAGALALGIACGEEENAVLRDGGMPDVVDTGVDMTRGEVDAAVSTENSALFPCTAEDLVHMGELVSTVRHTRAYVEAIGCPAYGGDKQCGGYKYIANTLEDYILTRIGSCSKGVQAKIREDLHSSR